MDKDNNTADNRNRNSEAALDAILEAARAGENLKGLAKAASTLFGLDAPIARALDSALASLDKAALVLHNLGFDTKQDPADLDYALFRKWAISPSCPSRCGLCDNYQPAKEISGCPLGSCKIHAGFFHEKFSCADFRLSQSEADKIKAQPTAAMRAAAVANTYRQPCQQPSQDSADQPTL